ncbi:TPA: hypothetical protein ACH3X3_011028 [Trebouxia sp. C0006]
MSDSQALAMHEEAPSSKHEGAAGAVLKRDQKAHEQQWQQPCSTAGVAVQHQDMSRHYGELKRFFTSCKALCYRLSSASKPT